jgi:hypothetical protein
MTHFTDLKPKHRGPKRSTSGLSSSLAPKAYANYESGMRQFAAFYHE